MIHLIFYTALHTRSAFFIEILQNFLDTALPVFHSGVFFMVLWYEIIKLGKKYYGKFGLKRII